MKQKRRKRKEDQWTNKATTKAEVGTTHGKRNYDQYAVCWKARKPASKKNAQQKGRSEQREKLVRALDTPAILLKKGSNKSTE